MELDIFIKWHVGQPFYTLVSFICYCLLFFDGSLGWFFLQCILTLTKIKMFIV